jgi:hypothetical protein
VPDHPIGKDYQWCVMMAVESSKALAADYNSMTYGSAKRIHDRWFLAADVNSREPLFRVREVAAVIDADATRQLQDKYTFLLVSSCDAFVVGSAGKCLQS